MARRRFFKRARASARSLFRRRRSGRRTSSGVKLFHPEAMAYGAVRSFAASMLVPLAAKLPGVSALGSLQDEAVMAGADYLTAKMTSGFVRNMAIDGLKVENARVGETLVAGFAPGIVKSSSQSMQMFG